MNVQRIGLTTPETRLYYQAFSKSRDESNIGMPRKEMIQLMSEIEGC